MVRQYQKSMYSVFENAVKLLGVQEGALAEELGFHRTAFHEWKKTGQFPKVAALACEGLIRRQGQPDGATVFLVKTSTRQEADTIQAVCKGLNVEFVSV